MNGYQEVKQCRTANRLSLNQAALKHLKAAKAEVDSGALYVLQLLEVALPYLHPLIPAVEYGELQSRLLELYCLPPIEAIQKLMTVDGENRRT